MQMVNNQANNMLKIGLAFSNYFARMGTLNNEPTSQQTRNFMNIKTVKRQNDLHDRIEALDITNLDQAAKADLYKFQILCGMLNKRGLDTAEKFIEILEKYNNRKAA